MNNLKFLILGCVKCKEGWIMNKENTCLDVNECAGSHSPCKKNQFCVNSEGSFKCLDCDRACVGCTGDGPDMCTQCAAGYVLVDNMCTGNHFCNNLIVYNFSVL